MKPLMMKQLGISTLLLLGFAHAALAANSIREIKTQQVGDQMYINIEFDQPLPAAPAGWSTKEPARIVFDFPDTTNQSGKATYSVNGNGLRNVQLVQTEQQTRMVLSLIASSGYETELKGNALLVKLAPFKQNIAATPPRNAIASPLPSKNERLVELNSVRDIVFRRAEQGQAQILIELSDGAVPLDIRRASGGLVVDLQDTQIPDRLLSKRDVNDFGTPVTHVTTSTKGSQGRIEIGAKGTWQHHAQLVNNQLKIELRQLTAAETNKLVPHGQEGKKISINFYDADLAMVLRTLAEISGRNVIVDPSLMGRKITVTLDNMPYDQAIELVMSQTNAGMRLRPDLVIFGARDVLLKRDVDLADEMARANEVAPLVTETFQLNYVSGSDVEKLIRVAQNDSSTNALAPITSTTPGSGGQPGASQTTLQLKGIMTSRGVLSFHGATNKLFIRDTQAVVDQVRDLIRDIDVPPKQVLVEARIVEVTTDFANNLGVRLNLFDRTKAAAGGHGVFGSSTRWGAGVVQLDSTASPMTNVDIFGAATTPALAASSTLLAGGGYNLTGSSSLNFMLFNSAATKILQVELAAAETDSRGKTISSPRVATQNRKPAKIENIQRVTVFLGISPTTGLPILRTYEAPLTLDVTPSITPDNRVDLDLKIAKSNLKIGAQGANNIDINTVNTNVMVENGGTVVIGGFYRDAESESQDRIPFLGDLPYVGFLFKNTVTTRTKSELLVFITPRIVNDALALR